MKQLLVFVLFAALFCWLMFSPIYKHVLVIRQALLQQEVDYMLEIGASGKYGYIDSWMVEQSRSRLAGYVYFGGGQRRSDQPAAKRNRTPTAHCVSI